MTSILLNAITAASRNEPDSGIISAVNHGIGRADIIFFSTDPNGGFRTDRIGTKVR